MATFRMQIDNGLTSPTGLGLTDQIIGDLVKQTAERVGWNDLGSPVNFGKQQVATPTGLKVKNIHADSGVEFKSGFLMFEVEGAQQKWEGQALSGGFRLDLQNISNGYANFSIQTNGANSKTIAKCMMQVRKSFGQGQLFHALKRSRDERSQDGKQQSCYLTFQ